jgi:hypothetical protein
MKTAFIFGGLSLFILSGCSETSMNFKASEPDKKAELVFQTGKSTQEDNAYWYSQNAEITSYHLEQARYGEIHEGTAVFVFVTEPFSPVNFTKADNPSSKNVPVLKLNQTRKFNTGMYPYSIMTSTFFPFKKGDHSIKVSSSSQDWCGHSYMEVRNQKSDHFQVDLDSYFEGQSLIALSSPVAFMEDDIWTMIRLRDDLPTGTINMYPSLASTNLLHIPYKPYSCIVSSEDKGSSTFYTMEYPKLDRSLTIEFEQAHPHKIIGWTETNFSGYDSKRKKLTTTATRMNSIRSDYWNRNTLADSTYRKALNI